jgi:phage terminase large subunit
VTTSRAEEVNRRQRVRVVDEAVTVIEDFSAGLREILEARVQFPSPVYRDDPVRFGREILGIETWDRDGMSASFASFRDRQAELLSLVAKHDRVACKSGRRVSKSNSAAWLALWFYCSFEDARVVMSSTTARQVDQVLWRELSMVRARSGRCVDCKREDASGLRIPAPCPHSQKIAGDIGELARTGLKSDDFREIVGFTARQAEAVQGIAGSNILFIIDEASGVPQIIFDAIEGNRAGGAKVVLLGNPTQNDGEFYDAFHSKKRDLADPKGTGYVTMTISSEESPNVVAGRPIIPGLATREYIREREIEWGTDSPLYKVHVKGDFAENEDGAIFSIHAIARAQDEWDPEANPPGRLYLGVDPAGASGTGDDSAFAVRRGNKVIHIHTRKGLSEEGHLAEILALLKMHRIRGETPAVVIDREGPIGTKLRDTIEAYLEKHADLFHLVALRSSDRAIRTPGVYDRMRDELVANLADWFKNDGTFPEDAHLAEELHEMRWEKATNGRMKVIQKKLIRKKIGRSPDRFDAVALSAWEPLSLREEEAEKALEQTNSRTAATQGKRSSNTDDEGDEDDDTIDRYDDEGRIDRYGGGRIR